MQLDGAGDVVAEALVRVVDAAEEGPQGHSLEWLGQVMTMMAHRRVPKEVQVDDAEDVVAEALVQVVDAAEEEPQGHSLDWLGQVMTMMAHRRVPREVQLDNAEDVVAEVLALVELAAGPGAEVGEGAEVLSTKRKPTLIRQ